MYSFFTSGKGARKSQGRYFFAILYTHNKWKNTINMQVQFATFVIAKKV